MKRHLSLLAEYLFQYTKVRLAYRGDFFISVVTTVVATVFGIAVVWLIFSRIPDLMGWSFYEILLIYGFSLLPMSLFNMLSINLYYFSQTYLIEGKFDRILLRPLNSLFQILFEQFRLESLSDFVLGVFLLVACSKQLGLDLTFLNWAFLLFAALCGCAIYVAVFLALTCVSFWMEDRIGIIPPVYNMLTFGRYPLDIYNPAVKFILSWIVPFGFATFYPSASILRAGSYQLYAWLLPFVTAIFLFLSISIWNRGVRNYSSTGS